jgi:hypothetical protein
MNKKKKKTIASQIINQNNFLQRLAMYWNLARNYMEKIEHKF